MQAEAEIQRELQPCASLPEIEPGKKQPSADSDLEASVPLLYDSRIRKQIQPCDTDRQRD